MSWFKRVLKKRKRLIKKAKKKFKKKFPKLTKALKFRKKILKKIGKGIKNFTVGMTVLLPLRPFKGLMKKQLKRKGVSTSGMKFPKIVEKFYKVVVKKGKSNYNELDDGWLENHPLMSKPMNEFTDEDNAIGTAIAGVVTAVLSFIKKAKKKKDKIKVQAKEAGVDVEKLEKQFMTPEEVEIANDADTAITKAKEELIKQEPVQVTNDKMKKYTKFAIFGVIGLLALILIIRRK